MDVSVIQLNMAQTVSIAAVLLIVGDFIKKRIPILERFFIPAPVIGGLVFSLIALIGHQQQLFEFSFYEGIRNFLLMVFFTTIGFSASLELLKKGGIGVAFFLFCSVTLLTIQNIVGVSMAKLFSIHPLIGLAAGSISLTGGHGTSAAFGPILEHAGAIGAMPAAIAASTWGLVFGCLIGGPIGLRLLKHHKLKKKMSHPIPMDIPETINAIKKSSSTTATYSTVLIMISIGIGSLFVEFIKRYGVTLPAYIGPMIIAAIVRNIIDYKKLELPSNEFDIIGTVSLSFFLVMALMGMKLWELAAIAGPLVMILIVQTAIVAAFAYFITYLIMGRDYDATVLATGHCGFALGATPNAMANMEAFTAKNGPSVKAFFVLPLVGSLFIDFFNVAIITAFLEYLK